MKTTKRIAATAMLCAMLFAGLATPAAAVDVNTCRNTAGALMLLVKLVQSLGECGSLSTWLNELDLASIPLGSAPSDVPAVTPTVPATEPPAQANPQPEVTPPKAETAVTAERAYELEVIRLINAIRAEHGLSALTENTALSDGARLKSQDMAKHGYFDHDSPTYGSPFDMMRGLGFSYRAAGENIARGYASAKATVDAWMASAGHRENILSTRYSEIGVGYVADGKHCTQWFMG